MNFLKIIGQPGSTVYFKDGEKVMDAVLKEGKEKLTQADLAEYPQSDLKPGEPGVIVVVGGSSEDDYQFRLLPVDRVFSDPDIADIATVQMTLPWMDPEAGPKIAKGTPVFALDFYQSPFAVIVRATFVRDQTIVESGKGDGWKYQKGSKLAVVRLENGSNATTGRVYPLSLIYTDYAEATKALEQQLVMNKVMENNVADLREFCGRDIIPEYNFLSSSTADPAAVARCRSTATLEKNLKKGNKVLIYDPWDFSYRPTIGVYEGIQTYTKADRARSDFEDYQIGSKLCLINFAVDKPARDKLIQTVPLRFVFPNISEVKQEILTQMLMQPREPHMLGGELQPIKLLRERRARKAPVSKLIN